MRSKSKTRRSSPPGICTTSSSATITALPYSRRSRRVAAGGLSTCCTWTIRAGSRRPGRSSTRPTSSNGRSQLASPLTWPAAEEVGPQQTHHELAVLIPHLAAPPNDAHGGPAAGGAGFQHLHLSAEPVSGTDRQWPAKLVDTGGAEADGFGHEVLDQEPHGEG